MLNVKFFMDSTDDGQMILEKYKPKPITIENAPSYSYTNEQQIYLDSKDPS